MNRFKCGDTSPDHPGLIFFRYRDKASGKEVWVTPERFEIERENKRHVQAKRRKTPEYKKKMREYFQDYYHRPYQKAKQASYYKQPEVRERHRIKYHASPKREEERQKAEQNRIEREAWKNSPERIAREKAVTLAAYERNKPKIVARARERRATDPEFRLASNVRRCVRSILTRKNHHKSAKTEELLGCSFSDFRKHIESRFMPGMTWDNISEWSIDHIIALVHFQLSEPVAQRYAFHFLNCRPLWKPDNLRKSDKTDWSLVDKYNLYEWIPYTNLQYQSA